MRRLVVLVILLGVVPAGCGGGSDAAPKPAAKVTPVPTTFGVELKPGVAYTATRFKPKLRLVMPAGGWQVFSADKPGNLDLEPETEQPVQDSGISFYHHPKVFDARLGGQIPGDAKELKGDFAEWLGEHPHLKTTAPEPVEALGLSGVAIDVRVTSPQKRQYRDCGKVEGDCVVMLLGGIEPVVYGSQSFGRFLVLDLGGGDQLIVEEWVVPRKTARRELKRLDAALAHSRAVPGR